MKKQNIIAMFVILVAVSLIFPVVIHANAAEPPSFTIIVKNAPEDLILSLQLPDAPQAEAIELEKMQKAWETYYRFYYHMTPLDHGKLDGAVLIVQSQSYSFQSQFPDSTFKTYNNLLTLELAAQSLLVGQVWYRVPMLVALRVLLTLLIEGLIFFAFGYRSKRSWIAFFIINIITQIGLNVLFVGPLIGSYWLIGFVVVEILVIVIEMIAFAVVVKEHRKRRAVLYAIVANLASLALGGWMIANLPV